MPYFIIFAIFVLYLFLMVIVIAITILYPQCSHLRHYVTSFLIWSSLGFVTSIVVYFLVLFLSLKIIRSDHQREALCGWWSCHGGYCFYLAVCSISGWPHRRGHVRVVETHKKSSESRPTSRWNRLLKSAAAQRQNVIKKMKDNVL